MTSRTGTEDSREANPGDIEIEEGIGPVVETVWETPGADTRGSHWQDEEEEVTFETDPCAQGASDPHAQDTSQVQDDNPLCVPQVAGAKTTGPETTEDSDDDDEQGSLSWKQKEILVLTHVLQEVSGIKLAGQVMHWLKKESITSVADLLIVGPDGLPATGWNLEEVEQRALGFLHLWWGGNAASDRGGDLDLFMNLTRDEFRRCVVQAHMESARSQIKEGTAAMSVTQESPAVATVDAPA